MSAIFDTQTLLVREEYHPGPVTGTWDERWQIALEHFSDNNPEAGAQIQRALAAAKSAKKFIPIWGALATVSFGASLYHGYRRNNSLGWALVWGLAGVLFPILTPTIAVAQGFGKRRGR